MLEVKLLGQFEVRLDSQPVEIPSRPAQSLLAFLILNIGTAYRREKVAGLLWPDSSENNARNNLRQALWRIRKSIGDGYLQADKMSITFTAEKNFWLDAQVLEMATASNAPVDVLEEAVSIYEGELLPGFYDPWVSLERERLQGVFEQKIQRLLQLLIKEGRWDDANQWAERWISFGQSPEPAYRVLMTSAAGRGDQAGVVAAFHRCVKAIEEDLGVEPSHETLELYEKLTSGEAIFQANKKDVRAGPPVQLPHHLTPFIGRQEELASLSKLLADPDVRLQTILGPGGIGKTRLAIEAARAQAESFADGVYFISLASVDDTGFITSQIADVLKVQFHLRHKREDWNNDTQIEQLHAYLKEKQLLLLLDNCEHLLTSTLPRLPAWEKSLDQQVTDIVQTAPQVKILATSRERLNLHGETLLPLDGLEFPASVVFDSPGLSDPAAADAIQLFRQGARRVRPDFELGPDNLADVVDICRLVGGIPLAIELSAAWVELLSPKEIAAEIRNSLDFLETDLGDIPDRQRSMRLIFNSTWGRLTPIEQEVFQQLSVFRGGFTREAAQAITGVSLRNLMALVNKSLLRFDSEGRYQVHELLRQYAAERLAEDPVAEAAVKDRHCSYFSTFLMNKEPDLRGLSQGQALTDIEIEIDNVRTAWRWAVAHEKFNEIEKAMESVCEYLRIRGRLDEPWRFFQPAATALGWEGFGKPEDVPDSDAIFNEIVQLLNTTQAGAENSDERQLILGKILARDNRHWCESPRSHWKACQTRRQSLKLLSQFGERLEIAWLLRYGAHTLLTPWQSIALYKRALAIFEEFGDERGSIGARYRLGWTAIQVGDYQEAERLFRDTLAMAQKLERPEIVMDCLLELGYVHWVFGDYGRAWEYCQQSILISAEIGYHSQTANNLRYLARIVVSQGDFRAAEGHLKDSLEIYEKLGLRGLKGEVLGELSHVAVRRGDSIAANDLAEHSLRICREQEHQVGMIEPNTVLGEVALDLGELESAGRYFSRAIKLASDTWRPSSCLHALVGLVRLLAAQGDVEGAYRLGTFVLYNPASWQWSKDIATDLLAQLKAGLSPESVSAAREWANEKKLEEVTRYYLSTSTPGDPMLSFA